MPSSPSTSPGNGRTHRTHGIMARLTRLAAGVVFVTLVTGAFTALAAEDAGGHAHHVCIHEKLQRFVSDSVARKGVNPRVLSRVGLPYVSAVTPGIAGAKAEEDDAASTLATGTSPHIKRSEEWGELRITVSAEDLTTEGYYCSKVGQVISNRIDGESTCTEADILTAEKRSILMNNIMPEALKLHRDRLLVKQVQGTWNVGHMEGTLCESFKVPDAHRTIGLTNTDFVVYLASVPSIEGVAAWAAVCDVFSDDHPAVGVMNIPAVGIVAPNDQYNIHSAAHEVAHALGFSDLFFEHTGISANVVGVRGKTGNVSVIHSTAVVAKAREHYGCPTMEYVELEDGGGDGTRGSHWKLRNAADEMMAGVPSVGYYTALTMAAFEDMGFYKAVYSKAQTMQWGSNAGCSFLDGKCVIDNVSQFPSMFCDKDERVFRCTPERLGLGTCGVKKFDENFPEHFRYFTVPNLGGWSEYHDWCPFVMPWHDGLCTQLQSGANENLRSFSTFSMASRCVDGNFTPKAIGDSNVTDYLGMCANLACNPRNRTYSIQVGNSTYIPCTPGQTIHLDNVSNAFQPGGYITCPPYIEVCQSNRQAALDYEIMAKDGTGGRDAATVDRLSPRTAAVALVALAVAAAYV